MPENTAPTPPSIDMPSTPTTTTRRRTSARRRSPLLAPAAMGVLGLLAGGGLVAALATDDEPRVATPAEADTASASGDVDAAPSSIAESPATDEAVTTSTTNVQPLRPSAVRIAGTTYIETAACVALPNSNPQFGVGDAHIVASLHRVEATDGQHLVIEQWTEDGFSSLAVAEPDGGYGRTESARANGAPTGEPVVDTVQMSGGRVIEVEHTLTFAAAQCPSTIVQGADEFTFDAYGAVDVCFASEESGLGFIASLHGGSVLNFVGDVSFSEYAGRLIGTFSDGVAFDAPFTFTDVNGENGVTQTGVIEAGGLSQDRSSPATIVVDVPTSSRQCTADEEGRFVS